MSIEEHGQPLRPGRVAGAGLAVMEILAGASGRPDAERDGRARRADPRRRAALPADAGRDRLCGAGRAHLPPVAAPHHARPHLAIRRIAVDLCRALHARGLAGAERNPARPRCWPDEDVVYVARVAGARIVGVALHVGTRLPAYCTSMGRVLLSGLSTSDLDASLPARRSPPTTERTVTDRAELARLIAEARARRLRHRRRGTGDRPALHRRPDPRPLRHDRRGDQRLDAVGAVPLSEMEREFLPLLKTAARSIEDFFVVQ